ALLEDGRNRRQGLDVVHHRRAAEEPHHRGEGRLEPGPALLPLEGLEHPGLLAADVRARAADDVAVEREVTAQHLLAEDAGTVRLVDGVLEPLRLELELSAD